MNAESSIGIATLVERKTRFVMLIGLPDGRRADQVADALTKIPAAHGNEAATRTTCGLLRQYFPKRTDLRVHSQADLMQSPPSSTTVPRQTLGWMSPSEALDEVLR